MAAADDDALAGDAAVLRPRQEGDQLAGGQGRLVFAVPGQVDAPGAEGVNELLRDGAALAATPGTTALTRMPCGASSSAKLRVRLTTAALLAA